MNGRTGSTRRAFILSLLLTMAATPLVLAGDHATGDVALDGYCPVAYAAMGKAVKGDPKFASEYQGRWPMTAGVPRAWPTA